MNPGTVNYPGAMIAPCKCYLDVAPGQLHWPGASSSSSDHYVPKVNNDYRLTIGYYKLQINDY